MAQRYNYNLSETFEAEPDQQRNQLRSEELYLHFAWSNSTARGPFFHPDENRAVDRHYASQWNTAARSNGYSSATTVVHPPHHHPNSYDQSRDSLHQSAALNVCTGPENHIHHPSSSNYGVDNFFDQSVANVRGPLKRKSPGISAVSERGSTSRYYSAGSSSNISSSSEIKQQNATLDGQHNRLEPLISSPGYRASHLPVGGESWTRNVRTRSALNLDSDGFRTQLPGHYSLLPNSSKPPVDHCLYPDNTHHASGGPFLEWTPVSLSGAPHGRTLPNNESHESNHFFARSTGAHPTGELTGYHQERISGRSSLVPPGMHTVPSHTRGVRSSYTHGSSPSSRFSMGNMHLGHMVPPNEGLQLSGENHYSRHSSPFGPYGWCNEDRSGRSMLSFESYHMTSEDASTHGRLTPEGLMIVDHSSYGSRNILDHHRDMRLDIDNMSYEELLALGERIGSVSTGVCKRELHKCLTETVYCSLDQVQEEGRCVICLDEYQHMDDVGTLKACGHDYHVECIQRWLSMKNSCPICKSLALPQNMNGK
ncbi:hypothetical protein vseg_010606 [Gypsophila vaccaria]